MPGPAGHGLSFMLGAGAAKRKLYCGGCSQGVGLGALLNVSRFFNRTMALGAETTGWFKEAGPVSASLWSAMGAVTAWVNDQLPLFLTGAIGVVGYHEANVSLASSSTSSGVGCAGRIGYDVRFSPGLAIEPYIGYVNTIGHLQVGRQSQVVSSLQFGVGLRVR